jgi:8-oxo-dGTP pyrophosphatase MutT (NUDIX family)
VTSNYDIKSLKKRLNPESSMAESEKSHDPVAAVAIIIDPKHAGASVLLIRRQDREGDPWSGQIAFPGGHKATKDQTLLQSAIREASEEVGIDLHEHELLGVLPLVYSHTRRMPVAPFVFQLRSNVAVRLNDEVAESFWAPLSKLLVTKTTTRQVEVEQGKLNVDCYIFGEHVIWGLTFRIINILLNKPQPNSS